MGEALPTLVGTGEIARRMGLTPERIRQLARLDDFPAPVARIGRQDVWRLIDVDCWFERRSWQETRSARK